jgi:hypothetical protein
MGGVSEGDAELEIVEGVPALRLTGQVSLANNGGFVQASVGLEALDLASASAVRLRVRALESGYYVHLRTRDCRLPWQHYAAPIPPGDGWRTVTIDLAEFAAYRLDAGLDPARLTRLGIVAAKRAFAADVAVARIEFLRPASP